jgi:integrase/recombinase XerD
MNIITANFPSLLQQFFVQRLIQQLNASSRTVTAYRDSFRLLLCFAERQLRKRPTELTLDDLNAPFVLAFLNYLEKERHNSIRSRNARFAAIRSFMGYVALQEPSALALTQSVLAISTKRFERPVIGFLSRQHIEAILGAPDSDTWAGRRDRVMLATLYNTGARVSEVTSMRVRDLHLEPGPVVHIHGKGRKERSVPLWRSTVSELKR